MILPTDRETSSSSGITSEQQVAVPEHAWAPKPQQSAEYLSSMPKLSRSPIHLLSAIVTLTTDKLWDLLLDMARHLPLAEQGRFLIMAGLLLLVITTFSTTLTQYWIENESRGVALAKGLSLGVLAGIPYSFGDTEVGLVFMAWSGINELQKASMQD